MGDGVTARVGRWCSRRRWCATLGGPGS